MVSVWKKAMAQPCEMALALDDVQTERLPLANKWKSAMNQFAILYEDRFIQPST